MKAVGYAKNGPIDATDSLVDITVDEPTPLPKDLLVEVHAISVNPVDTKIRTNVAPESGYKIIGWDVSGIVKSVGSDVSNFKVGDEVFYAGAIDRDGANSELHIVDERIVGHKPTSLSHAEAAALPLTAITAWELLFDRLGVPEGGGDGDTLLIIGGAGGVGSIMIQLANRFTKLNVVATASRQDTIDWCKKLGAHHTINHHQDMKAALDTLGVTPRYVAGLTATDKHLPAIAELIAPQGKLGLIDDPQAADIDIRCLKPKSISIHWEFMYTRSKFQTHDIAEQSKLLNRVSNAVDSGDLVSTMNRKLGPINAANLKQAHALQESGAAIGKTVLEGF